MESDSMLEETKIIISDIEQETKPTNKTSSTKSYIFIALMFGCILLFIYTRPKKCETMVDKKIEPVDSPSIPNHSQLLQDKIIEFNNIQMQSIAHIQN